MSLFHVIIHKSLDQFTGSYNMLKHGLRLAILIFTIIHVTFGGITETKGLVFDFLIFSQFSLIFSHKTQNVDSKIGRKMLLDAGLKTF